VKERFKKEKIRNTMIMVGVILVVSVFVIFVGELFGPKEEKVIPGVNIVNKDKLEQESFRRLYGEKLTIMEQRMKELTQTLDYLKENINKGTTPTIDRKTIQEPGEPITPPPSIFGEEGQQERFSEKDEKTEEEKQEEQFEQMKQDFLRQLRPEDLQPKTYDNLIVIDQAEFEKETEEEKQEYKRKHAEDTIPSGTFVEGILLSGVDAPTGTQAKSEPHPVLVNLKDKAFLPNKWRSDIKECFVVGSAYGDISAERAYIRSETLSCTKHDGSILERKIDGYVSGEDGKVGLAGTVVSKQGAMLARTLVAGFLEGVATAFNESNTNYQIGDEGVVKSFDSSEAGGMAAFSGMARAAERLSEFYMNMVNQMFPVVEINAGRVVNVVFLKQINLDETQEDYRPKFDIEKVSATKGGN
jgi:conjugal transfer pilus assembly protein TraB